jgi:phenylpyruvate tautomerase PptA (4-oxalocrotonate tautomerase family)
MTNEDLYNEEQLQQLKCIAKQLSGSAIIPIPEMPKKMQTEVVNEITAKVIGSIEVDNKPFTELGESMQKALEQVASEITRAVIENAPKPVTEVSVKNIDDAKQKTVTVDNLGKLEKSITELIRTIIDNQPIVNVEKQELRLPRSAKEAIAVRLSDGKGFYNAITQAVSNAVAVDTDPTIGYQIADKDDSGSTKYYGFINKYGAWYILRENSSTYRYVRGARTDSAGSLYTDAWTNRAGLTYGYFNEVW